MAWTPEQKIEFVRECLTDAKRIRDEEGTPDATADALYEKVVVSGDYSRYATFTQAAPRGRTVTPSGQQGLKPETVNRIENGRMIGERPGGNGTRSRYGAPRRPLVKEPSEKQTRWLNSMIEEIKGIDEELAATALRLAADAARTTGGRLTGGWGGSISKAIDDVKTVLATARRTARTAPRPATERPAYAPLPEVPAGYYAITGEDGVLKFYRVKITDRGRVYLDVQASDDLHRIPFGAYRAILGKIAQNPAAAGKAYADNLGRCYVCGRTLTDDESRSLGIGPKCRTL